MGYALYETPLGDAGYGVDDTCPYLVDGKPCGEEIDRGLYYLCGDQPGYATDSGCGRWFCGEHLYGSGRGDGLSQCPDCERNGLVED